MKIFKIILLSILFSGLNSSPVTRDTPTDNASGMRHPRLENKSVGDQPVTTDAKKWLLPFAKRRKKITLQRIDCTCSNNARKTDSLIIADKRLSILDAIFGAKI